MITKRCTKCRDQSNHSLQYGDIFHCFYIYRHSKDYMIALDSLQDREAWGNILYLYLLCNIDQLDNPLGLCKMDREFSYIS